MFDSIRAAMFKDHGYRNKIADSNAILQIMDAIEHNRLDIESTEMLIDALNVYHKGEKAKHTKGDFGNCMMDQVAAVIEYVVSILPDNMSTDDVIDTIVARLKNYDELYIDELIGDCCRDMLNHIPLENFKDIFGDFIGRYYTEYNKKLKEAEALAKEQVQKEKECEGH